MLSLDQLSPSWYALASRKKEVEYLLAVIPGDKHVDLTKLSNLVGGTKAAFAARDVAERLTASVCGSDSTVWFNLELKLIVERACWFMRKYSSNAARLDRSVTLHMEDYLTLALPMGEHIAAEATGRMKSRPCPPIDSREDYVL